MTVDIDEWLKKAKRSQKRNVWAMQVPPALMIEVLNELKEWREDKKELLNERREITTTRTSLES